MRFEVVDPVAYRANIEKTIESFEEVSAIFEVCNIGRDAAFIAYSNFCAAELIDTGLAEVAEEVKELKDALKEIGDRDDDERGKDWGAGA